MDPVALIVAALVAGAVSSAENVADQGLKDAYMGLKSLVKKCFGGRRAADVVLEEHEVDPETYQAPLQKHLQESGAAQDAEILEAAKKLLAMADPKGTNAGVYNVRTIKADRSSVAAAHIQGGVHMGPPQMSGRAPDPS